MKCRISGLEPDEIKCLMNCFDLFDLEIDVDGSGEIELTHICQLSAKFLVEDPDRHRQHEEGVEGRLQDLRQGGAWRKKNQNIFLIMFRSCK